MSNSLSAPLTHPVPGILQHVHLHPPRICRRRCLRCVDARHVVARPAVQRALRPQEVDVEASGHRVDDGPAVRRGAAGRSRRS